jgi:hypothetical protein
MTKDRVDSARARSVLAGGVSAGDRQVDTMARIKIENRDSARQACAQCKECIWPLAPPTC